MAAWTADSIVTPRWRPAPQTRWDLPRIRRRSCDGRKAGCRPWTPVRTDQLHKEKRKKENNSGYNNHQSPWQLSQVLHNENSFSFSKKKTKKTQNDWVRDSLPGSCDVYDREAVIWRCDTSATCPRSPELKPKKRDKTTMRIQHKNNQKKTTKKPFERFPITNAHKAVNKHRDSISFFFYFSLCFAPLCFICGWKLEEMKKSGGGGDLGLRNGTRKQFNDPLKKKKEKKQTTRRKKSKETTRSSSWQIKHRQRNGYMGIAEREKSLSNLHRKKRIEKERERVKRGAVDIYI